MHGEMQESWSAHSKVIFVIFFLLQTLVMVFITTDELIDNVISSVLNSIYLVDQVNSRLYMERIAGRTAKEILKACPSGGESLL